MAKFDLKDNIEASIKGLAQVLAEKAKYYAEQNNLTFDGTVEQAGEILWCYAPVVDMTLSARGSGAIEAMFSMAREADIKLSAEVMSLEDWGYVISPS